MTARANVLISNDKKELYSRASSIFSAYSFDTFHVPRDGKKICEAIHSSSPDIVIMDSFMPNLDAIGVMLEISRNTSVKTPMFMITSSFDDENYQREVIASGASYFFLEPFDVDIMAERVIQMFNSRKEPSKSRRTIPSSGSPIDEIELEVLVTNVIHQIGIPAHIKGYHYLRDSIMLVIQHPEIIDSVTKQLYPTVAKKNSTTSSRVERAIRHAIEVAWDRGDVDVLNSYFGYTIHIGRGKPTNSEFVAMISDRLRLKIRTDFAAGAGL